MKTEKRKVSDIKEAPYNPRRITDQARAGLRSSIDRFGLVIPLVWNKRTGNLVGGHQRFSVMKEKLSAEDEIDVVVVDMDELEEKTLNLALNNPGSKGKFTEGTMDLLATLKEGIGDLYDDLGMQDLEFVLERIDLSIDKTPGQEPPDLGSGGEKGPGAPDGSGKTARNTVRPAGIACPRCGSAWDRHTGERIGDED